MPDASPGNKKAKDDCPWLEALARGYAALHGTGSTQSRQIGEASRDHGANLADRLWRRASGTGEGGSARFPCPLDARADALALRVTDPVTAQAWVSRLRKGCASR